MIAKMLISPVIVLASLVVGAAPAGADPNPSNTAPNPFGGLTCNCQRTAPPSPDPAEFDRGIRTALSRG